MTLGETGHDLGEKVVITSEGGGYELGEKMVMTLIEK